MHKLTITTFAGQELVQEFPSKATILEYISKLIEVTPNTVAFHYDAPTVNVYGSARGKVSK